jgi:hypothetical protein
MTQVDLWRSRVLAVDRSGVMALDPGTGHLDVSCGAPLCLKLIDLHAATPRSGPDRDR